MACRSWDGSDAQWTDALVRKTSGMIYTLPALSSFEQESLVNSFVDRQKYARYLTDGEMTAEKWVDVTNEFEAEDQ